MPVSTTAWSSSSWRPGSSSDDRDAASPIICCHSPRTTTATSLSRAASTARCSSASSSKPSGSGGVLPGNMSNIEGNVRWAGRMPGAYRTSVASPSRRRSPSSTGTVSSRSKSKHHGPSVSRFESANGPTTATDPSAVASRGSRSPSLRSSTADRSAATRASSRWAGSASTVRARSSSTYGFSNSPSRTLAARTRRTQASIAASVTAPFSTASVKCPYAGSVSAISRSTPAATPRAPASARSAAKRWVTRFRTALASLTTNPSNPHWPRSTSLNSHWLAEAGMPFRLMYADITLPAPAAIAASNGGK